MSYQVIARKWRPQTFDDLVGQQHVTETLKNAIKNDRVAHAYIFSGARGEDSREGSELHKRADGTALRGVRFVQGDCRGQLAGRD